MQIKVLLPFFMIGAMALPMPASISTESDFHLQARAEEPPSRNSPTRFSPTRGSPTRVSPTRESDDSKKEGGHNRLRQWFHRTPEQKSSHSSVEEKEGSHHRHQDAPERPRSGMSNQAHRSHVAVVTTTMAMGRF
ncbi:uncharacterized protein PgNI_00125 [Pyricularia grisea]|uniref:Uncharacterized protein n=1 Tax=Pyricularia grisea TaxID=148305 RepID=A0A6P8BKA0_PYRGI|nr:uncharacterized protein PgNI_00125 [Pyricularia grisea]TLD17002.1 hypothetical protein PgNI_00125 [Pyricularia grisea]